MKHHQLTKESIMTLNIYAAWTGMLLGAIAGAVPGLFFRQENWLGGYGSWTRRMLRLGHISFFGIAFINLGFGLTAMALNIHTGIRLPAILFVVGAVTMPIICYLSVVRDNFRHFFFIPTLSIVVGLITFLWRIF
jgi:hypothetical protein